MSCWSCGAPDNAEDGTFRQHVNAWRGDRSWREISRETGIHASPLNRWWVHKKAMTVEHTMMLCKAAGLNPTDFMDEWTS